MPQDKSTGALYLDQRQAMGIDFGGSERADYPNLSPDERRVADAFATGLFLSKSSCQWAVWNALHGPQEARRDAFKSVLKVLSGSARKVVMRAL